jgi:hypothetical protein
MDDQEALNDPLQPYGNTENKPANPSAGEAEAHSPTAKTEGL